MFVSETDTEQEIPKNKKNGGVIPPIKDKRVLMVPVGCGNSDRDWETNTF